MSNLNSIYTIDNGNSNPHIGFFESGHLQFVRPFTQFWNEYETTDSDRFLLSNVGLKSRLPKHINKQVIDINKYKDSKKFFDMPFDYTQTIGDDRLFQCYFIYKKYVEHAKNKKIILIDAGTFTTIDFISEKGFNGGFIFPSLKTFFNSYLKGAMLPQVEIQNINWQKPLSIPHSTEEAISDAAKLYFESIINKILQNFKSYTDILITGGEGKFIKPLIDQYDHVITKYHPYFIHYSLEYINQRYLEREGKIQ